MTEAHDPLATPFPMGSIGWTKHLARHLTGQAVETISGPGGPGRASARLTLADGRTVIATRRATPERTATEAALLDAMSGAGAPVPRVIGYAGGLLLQEDAGRNRLSHAFAMARDEAQRFALAEAAIEALEQCRAVFHGLPEAQRPKLPSLGQGLRWAETYVARPVFLSGDLGIARPKIDADALAAALAHPPERLTRWNARTGRAAVQRDGSVMWHGWHLAGYRGGAEDLAFLLADEYWPLEPAATNAILARHVPDARRILMGRFAVMIAANRMADRLERRRKAGVDQDPLMARRLDLPATAPQVLVPHADRMAEIATADTLTAGFADWFQAAARCFEDEPVSG